MANPLYGQNKYDESRDDSLVINDSIIQKVNFIADADDDVTITSLVSGRVYHFGTSDGKAGSTDGDSAMTFKLPTPAAANEQIVLYHTNASVIAKLIGVVSSVPASQTITYYAYAQQVFIETATTATGVNGTANTMVKVSASSTILGDIWTFTSMSPSTWRMYINDSTNIVAAGDIVVDPGNASGYID